MRESTCNLSRQELGLEFATSNLLALILKLGKSDRKNNLKNIICRNLSEKGRIEFYLKLKAVDEELFSKLVNESGLAFSSELDGHKGFIRLLKVYEINKDKKSYLKLFERFLKMRHLLVD